jgi:hypothetical protein
MLKGTEWHGFFTGLIKRVEINNFTTRYYTGTDKVWVNRNASYISDPAGTPLNSSYHLENVKVYSCVLVHEARHRDQWLNNSSVFNNLPESELDAYQIMKQCLVALRVSDATINGTEKIIDCIRDRSCPEKWRRV